LRVTLLERDMPGRGATWAAAGMLSPLSEAGEGGPFLDFSLESLALYPDWFEALEAESGVAVEYRACGKLRLARTGEEIGELERARDLAQARGLHAELVPAEALAHEVSGMAPGWTWGLRVLEDHRVDPRRLGEALLTAARRAGV